MIQKAVQTFPRRFRLSRREGFTRILQQRARTNSWFAVHSEANSIGHARLGMSVSKRLLPAATQRNFVKRMIRECFRIHARQGAASDIVIRLRKPLDSKDISVARFTLAETLKTVLAAK
ncbi:ribonuclease P protein component [Sideroxyarcus emersonii]|uniref:ribonuclease P protein component n=1 Tax=Sideroxyarcus emersonii TaxID=2764705 RepID=UPI001F018FA1|nr:ribonuclease P protein component [Sideroxyarcus emersonii]